MIKNFIKINIYILFDFFLFLILHILINLLINNYINSFIAASILYFIYLFKFRKNLNYFTTVILIFFLFTLTVPTMNKRSLSVFLLNKIKTHKIINKEDMSLMYNKEYIIDEEIFLLQRLNEQVDAGNLILKKNYELTLRGHIFVAIFKFFNWVY